MRILKRLSFIYTKQSRCSLCISSNLNQGKEPPVNDDFVDEALQSDKHFQNIVDEYFNVGKPYNCIVIQPYIKWGPQKLKEITHIEQTEEAIALVKTLKNWTVQETLSVPLESFDKKTLFRSGNLEKLKELIRSNGNINAAFINLSMLKKIQSKTLSEELGIPILDRYRIVMQILKTYATTKHAKLQIALAELHFMQKTMSKERIFPTTDPETLRLLVQEREKKLKEAIKQLRTQRALLRNRRKLYEFPVIAVVGYTNSGKTSIIKALTGDTSLIPKDQLFATLDVTMHQGGLPSGLNVLYVDTVGFISDIPTDLIECFIATLEDAIFADVILHVEDMSSSCVEYKRQHVLTTLMNLSKQMDCTNFTDKIISVGNKCDLLPENTETDVLLVSARDQTGLNELQLRLEQSVIRNTDRKIITVKVPSGGEEIRWLRKNATIVLEVPDKEDNQYVKAKIIITNANLGKFKHKFI